MKVLAELTYFPMSDLIHRLIIDEQFDRRILNRALLSDLGSIVTTQGLHVSDCVKTLMKNFEITSVDAFCPRL